MHGLPCLLGEEGGMKVCLFFLAAVSASPAPAGSAGFGV